MIDINLGGDVVGQMIEVEDMLPVVLTRRGSLEFLQVDMTREILEEAGVKKGAEGGGGIKVEVEVEVGQGIDLLPEVGGNEVGVERGSMVLLIETHTS